MIVGVNKDLVYSSPKTLMMKEASIRESFVGSKDELQLLVDLAIVGKIERSCKYQIPIR